MLEFILVLLRYEVSFQSQCASRATGNEQSVVYWYVMKIILIVENLRKSSKNEIIVKM